MAEERDDAALEEIRAGLGNLPERVASALSGHLEPLPAAPGMDQPSPAAGSAGGASPALFAPVLGQLRQSVSSLEAIASQLAASLKPQKAFPAQSSIATPSNLSTANLLALASQATHSLAEPHGGAPEHAAPTFPDSPLPPSGAAPTGTPPPSSPPSPQGMSPLGPLLLPPGTMPFALPPLTPTVAGAGDATGPVSPMFPTTAGAPSGGTPTTLGEASPERDRETQLRFPSMTMLAPASTEMTGGGSDGADLAKALEELTQEVRELKEEMRREKGEGAGEGGRERPTNPFHSGPGNVADQALGQPEVFRSMRMAREGGLGPWMAAINRAMMGGK